MAVANDDVTINSWRPIWKANVAQNHKKFGSFAAQGIGKEFAKHHLSPAIIVGSGPSLKKNVKDLASVKDIPIYSCLHNFHYLEDHGVEVDGYVTLDAGQVTVEEVSEGGTRTPEEYWELTKDRKLYAFIGSNPDLMSKWRGEIIWYNCPVPDPDLMQSFDAVEPFHSFVSTGGNVFGATLYIARGIFAANPIIFLGADFSFSYDKKFHAWDSKYDATLGDTIRVSDIFGNKVHTWQSYLNFKAWFDHVAIVSNGIFINATEGGIFGAYENGNIQHVTQLTFKQVLDMYSRHENVRLQMETPTIEMSAENKLSLLF